MDPPPPRQGFFLLPPPDALGLGAGVSCRGKAASDPSRGPVLKACPDLLPHPRASALRPAPCRPGLTSPGHPTLPGSHHGSNIPAGPGPRAPRSHWGGRGCRRWSPTEPAPSPQQSLPGPGTCPVREEAAVEAGRVPQGPPSEDPPCLAHSLVCAPPACPMSSHTPGQHAFHRSPPAVPPRDPKASGKSCF